MKPPKKTTAAGRFFCLLALLFGSSPLCLSAQDAARSTPLPVLDESLRAAIARSFHVQYVLRDTKDTTLVQVMIQVDDPPTGMAFDIALQAKQNIWPLGPVAWAKGEIGWWAYDIDLPENVRTVDIVLTPSASAAALLKRQNSWRLSKLGAIWSGAPIVLTKIEVGTQEISMCPIEPPKLSAAREEAMENFLPSDPVVQRLNIDHDWHAARVKLQIEIPDSPTNASALYDLACLVMADGDFEGALQRFATLRALSPPEPLLQKAQRQSRRVCALELYQALHGNASAMRVLGSAYELGWAVTQVFQNAKYWYRRAANAGDPQAMRRLAAMYEHETGATIDTPEARAWYRRQTVFWYRKAANLGDKEAKQWLSAHNNPRLMRRHPPGARGNSISTAATAGSIRSRQSSAATKSEYDQWVHLYARTNHALVFDPKAAISEPLLLSATVVEGDQETNGRPPPPPVTSGISTHGVDLSVRGQLSYFYNSSFGSKGGSSVLPMLDRAQIAKLQSLLPKLPEDASQLPTPGRRMLLQANVAGQWISRVYDRANAPDVVWEILLLARSGIGSWVLDFKPESEIDARGFAFRGFLALSPHGRNILFAAGNGLIQFWEPITHEFLAEIPNSGGNVTSIAFNRAGSFAAIGGDQCVIMDARRWNPIATFKKSRSDGGFDTLTLPHFTPDDRYLLVQSSKPSLEIYDTQTWQLIDHFPGLPAHALQYFPSPNGKRAVAQLNPRALILWDPRRQRRLATLDPDACLANVSFSPDQSLIAIVTAQTNGYLAFGGPFHLRIRHAATGDLLHELSPLERASGAIDSLAWSPDGHYLFAATTPDASSPGRINVFDIKTGRPCGDFSGCPSDVTGIALLPSENQLVAGCEDGRIRFWNFAQALKRIKTFQASLPPFPAHAKYPP